MKPCTDCKVEKPLERYSIRKNPNNTTTVYRGSICNDCLSRRMKEWRNKNTEKFLAYQKQWHTEYFKKHPEKVHEYWHRQYYKDVELSRQKQREKRARAKAKQVKK